MPATDEQLVAWLIEEARSVGEQITQTFLSSERVLATGVAVLSLGAGFAVAREKSYLLMGFPILASVIAAYAAFMSAELMALGGYRAALERKIHLLAGRPVSIWESVLAEQRHGSTLTWVLRGSLAVVLVAINAGAIIASFETRNEGAFGHDNSTLWIAGTLLEVAIGAVAIAAAFVSAWREHKRTRIAAELGLR